MLETHDFADVLDLGVPRKLRSRRLAYVEQLAPKREDTVLVASDDIKPGNGECLGRVSLSENERALLALRPARPVGVCQLKDAGDPAQPQKRQQSASQNVW